MYRHASLNRAFRLVWNHAQSAWKVAPESAKGQGKASGTIRAAGVPGGLSLFPRRLRLAILAGLGLMAASPWAFALDAQALPTGGQVTQGQAHLGQQGATLTIDQASQRAVIDWQGFDVGKDAQVCFNQPNAQAATLNRVTGGSRSQILGRLDANGQVYLVNGAGVLFGQSAQVNVGGIVASTLNISDQDFLAGKDRFTLTENSTGEVVNQGSITAKGGKAVLLGKTVRNEGTINTEGGNTVLAAGKEITFSAGANGHLNLAVDASELQVAVHNGGAIQADGGQIVLNAQGANALAAAVVSNTGSLQARSIAEREGKILLLADLDKGGSAKVAGTLDASAPSQSNGGFIETSAANVRIAKDTRVTTQAAQGKTGTWLIDPLDFTVSAGNATQTDSGIGADILNASLANTSVTLQTVDSGSGAGDIHVRAAVNWSADTTLTLNAHRNINIDAAITATGSNAGLSLNHGNTRGDSSATPISGSDYHIKAPVTLSGVNASLRVTGNTYTLIHSMAQLDAIDTSGLGGRYALASDLDASGTTYDRALIGIDGGNAFTGTFAGLGHTVSNLTIDSTNTFLGLLGVTGPGATLRDLGLLGGSVRNTYTGPYSNSLGGLVGYNQGTISNAYATGSVTGTDTGTFNEHGGLVGYNAGTISNAYATGSVTGRGKFNYLGGLVGRNDTTGTISHAYATGSVTGIAMGTGTNRLGGLVGVNLNTINNAYATGSVTGTGTFNEHGGLVGWSQGTISNAHWDSVSTGQAQALGYGTNATNSTDIAANRYTHSAYTAFGIWREATPGIWVAYDNQNAPQWVHLEGSTRPFLYSEYSTSVGNAHQLQLMALDLGARYQLSRDIDASATRGSDLSGLWSTKGFVPIAGNRTDSDRFTGLLDGAGHTLDQLFIRAGVTRTTSSSAFSYAGLFGMLGSGARVRDLTLHDVDVASLIGTSSFAGGVAAINGLAAAGGEGELHNVHVTGDSHIKVSGSGSGRAGGLVGINNGRISDSSAQAQVEVKGSGLAYAGGLAGNSSLATSRISDSHASGTVSVTGADSRTATYAGGLVGENSGTLDGSEAGQTLIEATGQGLYVFAGSLIGNNASGTLSNNRFLLTGDATIKAQLVNPMATNQRARVSMQGDTVQAADALGKTLTLRVGYGTSNNNGVFLEGKTLLTSNALVIDASGDVGVGGEVDVSRFTLQNGNWRQNGVLPSFSATDFRLAGGSFLRVAGGNGTAGNAYQLVDVYGLQGMTGFLSSQFALNRDIDARGTATWNCSAGICAGFVPLGTDGAAFNGQFEGNRHVIDGLTIRRPTERYVGLFGNVASGARIQRLGVTGVDILGHNYVGGLAGYNSGTLAEVYSSGRVGGDPAIRYDLAIGGLVGANAGSLSDAYAATRVDGDYYNGGLVGLNDRSGVITAAYATGDVTGGDFGGGLVGSNDGSIVNSYATGATGAFDHNGGLAGHNSGSISGSFYAITNATGNVINNSGNTAGSYAGNGNGAARTWLELANPATFSGWDTKRWTFAGTGANVAGYGVVLPYLTQVTRAADVTRGILFQGGSGSSSDPYTLANWQQLAGINLVSGRGYTFHLLNSLGSSSTGYTAFAGAMANGGAGWQPLGDLNNPFSGTFEGRSHTLSDLVIKRDDTSHVGLFGITQANSAIRNLGLLGVRVTGGGAVGGLVGNNQGRLVGVYVSGDITGKDLVGGLVGSNEVNGSLANAYMSGSVTGSGATIGGLVGANGDGSSISDAYSSARASGSNLVGGLVGGNFSGTIANSLYATTDATGNVINNGGASAGAFRGNTFGTAKTLVQLTQLSTFADAGWDIDAVGGTGKMWRMYDGHTGPLLRSFLTPLTATAIIGAVGRDYDGTTQAVAATGYRLSDPGAALLGSALYDRVQTRNAGTYALGLNGLYSDQQGYDISVVDGSYQIAKAQLTLSASGDRRAYDGSSGSTGPVGHSQLFGSDRLNGMSQSFDSKNAGTRTLRVDDGYRLEDGNGGNNYAVVKQDASGEITKAQLTLTASSDRRAYDGSTGSKGPVGHGPLFGSDRLNGLSQSFDSRNAGARTLRVDDGYRLDDGNGGNNYTVVKQSASGEIAKAQLTITASSDSRAYDGSTASTGTAGHSQLFGSDSLNGLSQSFDSKNAGARTLRVDDGYRLEDGNGGNNYTVVKQDAGGEISKQQLTITGTTIQGKTYDGTTTARVNVGTLGNLVTGETLAVTATGDFDSASAGPRTAVARYALSDATGGLADNYELADSNGLSANIAKAQAVVTANSGTTTYNGLDQQIGGFNVNGLVNGETATVLRGITTHGGQGRNAGTYIHGASGSDGNYDLTFVDGALTINKAKATVTANSNRVTYNGQRQSVSGFSVEGLVNGEDQRVLTDVITTGGEGLNAGNYVHTARGGDSNYELTFKDGTLTIDKARLTVTVNDDSRSADGRPYHGGNGVNYTGFVHDEDASVLGGRLVYGGSAQGAVAPGNYDLSISGLSAINYELTYVDGRLKLTGTQVHPQPDPQPESQPQPQPPTMAVSLAPAAGEIDRNARDALLAQQPGPLALEQAGSDPDLFPGLPLRLTDGFIRL